MNALLSLALVVAVVLAVGVIALAWLAFGMSDTLTQLLILLKDQDETRREAEATAIEIRTRRHIRIADYLNEIVKALIVLRISPPRFQEDSAVSDDEHKTLLMQPPSPTTPSENAPEQPPAVSERNVQRPRVGHLPGALGLASSWSLRDEAPSPLKSAERRA